MPRENYRRELHALSTHVRAMGDLVRARLGRAVRAMERGDERLARSIVEGDEEVNRRYLELEGDCVDLIALQQPVASDLRFVAASFKITTDLERIGDLATNLATYAIAAEREDALGADVLEVGREVCSQLERALDVYESGDVEACHDVAVRDDRVDACCLTAGERIIRELIEQEVDADDPWAVETLLDDVGRVLLALRDLERVGDHAVNVAARTLYAAENDPRLIY